MNQNAKQKEARKKLIVLLHRLKKAYDVYDNVDTANDITKQVRDILNQYGSDLPPDVKQPLDSLTSLTNNTPEGIKNFMSIAENTIKTSIGILPKGIPIAVSVGIGVSIAAIIAASVVYFVMVDINITSYGCDISDTTLKAPPIQVNIDAKKDGMITVSGVGFSRSVDLPANIKKIEFDGTSLLGNSFESDLGSQKIHHLVITC